MKKMHKHTEHFFRTLNRNDRMKREIARGHPNFSSHANCCLRAQRNSSDAVRSLPVWPLFPRVTSMKIQEGKHKHFLTKEQVLTETALTAEQ